MTNHFFLSLQQFKYIREYDILEMNELSRLGDEQVLFWITIGASIGIAVTLFFILYLFILRKYSYSLLTCTKLQRPSPQSTVQQSDLKENRNEEVLVHEGPGIPISIEELLELKSTVVYDPENLGFCHTLEEKSDGPDHREHPLQHIFERLYQTAPL